MTDFLHFVLPGLPESKEKELARDILAALKHLPGKHEQASHGRRGGSTESTNANSRDIPGNSGNYENRDEQEKTIVDKIIYEASPDGNLVSGDRLSDFGITGNVTVYRGVPTYAEDRLLSGNLVLLDRSMAQAYSPKGKVISEKVPTNFLTFYQKNAYQIELKYEPPN